MGLGVELVIPAVLQDTEGASQSLLNALRKNSPAIAKLIETRVRARTPRLTGALREAETSQAYTGSVTSHGPVNLARWYADDGPQLEQWGRVYVEYQEGPPLGLHTYTAGEHQMYNAIDTDDHGLIQAWAEAAIQDATDALTSGGSSTQELGAA